MPPITNAETVPQPKDEVWKILIAGLSKQSFVINNLDKDSGLINVSYSGDPVSYVDCGAMHTVTGGRRYDFSGASAKNDFEMTNVVGHSFLVHRTVNLEGRINILVRSVDAENTTITVNAKYILTRTLTARDTAAYSIPESKTDTLTFNSGQSAVLPSPGAETGGQRATCNATGQLEQEILALVKPQQPAQQG